MKIFRLLYFLVVTSNICLLISNIISKKSKKDKLIKFICGLSLSELCKVDNKIFRKVDKAEFRSKVCGEKLKKLICLFNNNNNIISINKNIQKLNNYNEISSNIKEELKHNNKNFDNTENFINFIENKESVIKKEMKEKSFSNITDIEYLDNDLNKFENISFKIKNSFNSLNKYLDNLDNDIDNLSKMIKEKINLSKKNVKDITINSYMKAYYLKSRLDFSSKNLKIGNKYISKDKIILNTNEAIIIGGNSIKVENIIYLFNLIKDIKNYCGSDYKDCKIITQSKYQKQQFRFKEIKNKLDNINKNINYVFN